MKFILREMGDSSDTGDSIKNNLPVLLGAVAGGVVGYFVTSWLWYQFSIAALAVPGGLAGLGAGIFKCKSNAIAAVCGGIALAAGIFATWKLFPFIADQSFGYFLAHLHTIRPYMTVMIVIGAFIGYWVPYRRK
jgi:hypothetical protein